MGTLSNIGQVLLKLVFRNYGECSVLHIQFGIVIVNEIAIESDQYQNI